MVGFLQASLIVLAGCALALQGPTPSRPGKPGGHCDDSKALVVIDGFAAGISTAIGLGLAALHDKSRPCLGDGSSCGGKVGYTPGLLVLGVATLYGVSALRGNNIVNSCRAHDASVSRSKV
jgi:hypothetical protein